MTKGNSVAMCMTHRRPLNVCQCGSTAPFVGVAEHVSDLRERQAAVNAEQWLDQAEARDHAERVAEWTGEDVPRGEGLAVFWWGVGIGAAGIACVLIALYMATQGRV